MSLHRVFSRTLCGCPWKCAIIWNAVSCVLLILSSVARAQSPDDGYHSVYPERSVYVLTTQSDNRILIGGDFSILNFQSQRFHIGRINPDGSLDESFNPGANGDVKCIVLQRDGKILVGGLFTMIGGGGSGTTARNRIARLNPDGSLDASFDPGANGDVDTIAVQADGKILLGGSFTTLGGGGTGTSVRNHIGRLNADGTIDAAFDPGANNQVRAICLQADGQILVGGDFTMLGGGGTGTVARSRLGRLFSDGSIDENLNQTTWSSVRAILVQSDGKALIAERVRIWRVNRDGTLDASFSTNIDQPQYLSMYTEVCSLALLPDGKILVGGHFRLVNGVCRWDCARLNPNGSVDQTYDPSVSTEIYAMVPLSNGHILVGGGDDLLEGYCSSTPHHLTNSHLGMLNPDGTPDVGLRFDSNGGINAVAFQPDGKIVVGGRFSNLGLCGAGTVMRSNIGRFNPDGTPDSTFDPGTDGSINAIVIQPDGKILIGGYFTAVGGGRTGNVTRNNIARLNPDGSVDESFGPGANDAVSVIVLQPDGRILLGGYFWSLGGGGVGNYLRLHIGRLNSDGSMDSLFDPGADSSVFAIKLQPDGKILVGGSFLKLGGGTGTMSRPYIGRLNPDGSVDSFNPGANGPVLCFELQGDGQILVGGYFTTMGGATHHRVARLTQGGDVDPSFNPQVDYPSNYSGIYVRGLAIQANGQILLGGFFGLLSGVERNHLARIDPDGTLDSAFDPDPSSNISFIATPPDGRILVAGSFSRIAGSADLNRIAYLFPDGSIDRSFLVGVNGAIVSFAMQPDGKILAGGSLPYYLSRRYHDGSMDYSLTSLFPPAVNSAANSFVIQTDGKIVVGGAFTTLGGGDNVKKPRSYIGAFDASGAVVSIFDPGANAPVQRLAGQPDGKIVVAGEFTTLGGGGTGAAARAHIGRLNADGSLDDAFDPGADGIVYALAIQPDGKILVGGDFTTLHGVTRNRIGRLNQDGSLDNSFDPGANDTVRAFLVQPDGKIVVGGAFTTLGGGGSGTASRHCIGRLNANGTLDTGFDPGANGEVDAFALQQDGMIIAGGYFTTLGGGGTGSNDADYIARLFPDGVLDPSFTVSANFPVQSLCIQPDGRVLVGGWFTELTYSGVIYGREGMARLTNTGRVFQNLIVSPQGSAVTWERSGPGPEPSQVAFEVSLDGTNYSPLGAGSRTSGGWEIAGLSLPMRQNLFVRARGFHTAGSNGSMFVDSVRNVFLRGSADLVSPAGNTVLTSPVFTWNAVPMTSWYRLWVSDASGVVKIDAWYTADQAGCSSGAGACTVNPAVSLARGPAQWWVQTWNEDGLGLWSNCLAFNVSGSPPGKAALLAPAGTVVTTTPVYSWNAVPTASWYYLWVDNGGNSGKITTWYTAAQAGCASGTGTCSVSPTTQLDAGASAWWLQTWNGDGLGPWSGPLYFNVVPGGFPGKAVSVSPAGTIAGTLPAYTWEAVANATWYYLWVDHAGTSGKISTWYTAAQAGCLSGAGTCTVTPATPLAPGAGTWWIRTWNAAGYGPWSDPLSFTVEPAGTPGQAILISPAGTITASSPAYTWNAVPNASWYYLWVDISGTPGKIKQWYTAAQASCPSGSGICSVTPAVALPAGAAQWWIETWNEAGCGPWSHPLQFEVGDQRTMSGTYALPSTPHSRVARGIRAVGIHGDDDVGIQG